MRAPPFLAAPGGVAISRWQCGQPCPAWKRVTVPSSDTATVRGPTMGKDQGDEKSSPQGWQGRRKVEKQATRDRHAVLHEWTQGGPGGLESDHRRPSVLRLGPLAGSGWLGWGSTADTSLPSPPPGRSQPAPERPGQEPHNSPSCLAQVGDLALYLRQVRGPWEQGKHAERVGSPEWGTLRWHWTAAR